MGYQSEKHKTIRANTLAPMLNLRSAVVRRNAGIGLAKLFLQIVGDPPASAARVPNMCRRQCGVAPLISAFFSGGNCRAAARTRPCVALLSKL